MASARHLLLEEMARAIESLAPQAHGGTLRPAAREAIEASRSEALAILGRAEPTVVVIGARRRGTLLDAWIDDDLFGAADIESVGPAIVVRPATRPSYRARMLDGTLEELTQASPRAPGHETTTEPAPPPELGPSEPPPHEATSIAAEPSSWLGRFLARLVALLSRFFGRRPRRPAMPIPAAEVRPSAPPPVPPRDGEGERDDAHDATHPPLREWLAALVDSGARAAGVAEVVIAVPSAQRTGATLIDLRGALVRSPKAALARVRAEADVCALTLEGSGTGGVERDFAPLAREVADALPHLFVITDRTAERLARSWGIEPRRIVVLVPSEAPAVLASHTLDERALMSAEHVESALRSAQRAVDEAIAEDAARDREALDRLASRALPERGRRRDETRQNVRGAVAGRAIRIVQGVLAMLDAELRTIRDERSAAVAAARSRDEVRTEVAAAGPPLHALAGKLAVNAQSLVHEALSQHGPALLGDLDRRVAAVLEDASTSLARPVWPPPPRVAIPEEALVAEASLAQGESLHAEIGWTDSVLRSLEKVKQRCAEQLVRDLARIGGRARAEVLRAEPLVAKSLNDALESWILTSSDVYSSWLEAAVATEESGRSAARARRHRLEIAKRDAWAEHERRIASLAREVARV